MIVVWVNPRAITSPRTPPIAIRSPTLNVFPRRMTKYPAIAVMTRWSANASPAEISPRPVVRVVGSSNQIDATPNTIRAPTNSFTPWRAQNRPRSFDEPRSNMSAMRRNAQPRIRAMTISEIVNSNFLPLSAFTPTRRVSNK